MTTTTNNGNAWPTMMPFLTSIGLYNLGQILRNPSLLYSIMTWLHPYISLHRCGCYTQSWPGYILIYFSTDVCAILNHDLVIILIYLSTDVCAILSHDLAVSLCLSTDVCAILNRDLVTSLYVISTDVYATLNHDLVTSLSTDAKFQSCISHWVQSLERERKACNSPHGDGTVVLGLEKSLFINLSPLAHFSGRK